ncbi:AP-4 complex accessory subunit Tepsin-like isoform X2 [Dermacentor albipictus]
MTLENDGQYAEQVVDYLLGALLEGRSPTKVKCLRVLQHVITNGHTSVRTILARKDAALRSVANVSGGGSENQCLRLLAKDLLHAVHDDGAVSHQSAGQLPPVQQETRSYSGLGASVATTGKYQGFGNAPVGPKTLAEQVTDGIARVVDKIAGKPADKAASDLLTEGLPKFQPVTVQSPASTSEKTTSIPQQAVKITAKPQKARKKGHAGGGWDDDEDETDDGNVSGTVSDSASLGDSTRTSDLPNEPLAELYEKEAQAVDAFVDPSLEFPPLRRELDDARERCAALNMDRVAQLLTAKVFAPQESMQMRALVLIEALLRKGDIDLASQGAPLLAQLQDLQAKSSDPVQVKARKISLIIQKLIEEPET